VLRSTREEDIVSKHSSLAAWSAERLGAPWRRVDGTTAAIGLALLALILWGDTLLPLLGHGLHVLIEVVESALEHLLESAFHFSPRQAQVVIAWSGLALAIHLAVILSRKAYRAARRAYFAARARWRSVASSPQAALVFRTAVGAGALGAAFHLFS
jgi:hypothetical protein